MRDLDQIEVPDSASGAVHEASASRVDRAIRAGEVHRACVALRAIDRPHVALAHRRVEERGAVDVDGVGRTSRYLGALSVDDPDVVPHALQFDSLTSRTFRTSHFQRSPRPDGAVLYHHGPAPVVHPQTACLARRAADPCHRVDDAVAASQDVAPVEALRATHVHPAPMLQRAMSDLRRFDEPRDACRAVARHPALPRLDLDRAVGADQLHGAHEVLAAAHLQGLTVDHRPMLDARNVALREVACRAVACASPRAMRDEAVEAHERDMTCVVLRAVVRLQPSMVHVAVRHLCHRPVVSGGHRQLARGAAEEQSLDGALLLIRPVYSTVARVVGDAVWHAHAPLTDDDLAVVAVEVRPVDAPGLRARLDLGAGEVHARALRVQGDAVGLLDGPADVQHLHA
mmetsp:Transcript_133005/g.331876  ORF Transcript_133005/g.331876 Transcript_133005/m.331876 type:complete len:400 (-) Transcript_133005:557-1756(-)